ncbi:MAG: hypothetical protein Q9196_001957 [Gyalolechia fulgens]
MLRSIPSQYLGWVRKIGFAVIDNSAVQHDFRVWHDFCAWINQRLPDLRHIYIYLFGPSKPSQRFLFNIVRLLDSIPGQKTIELRASNNRKRMVGNTLAHLFKSRRPDAPSITVLGGCYCQCWTPPLYSELHGAKDLHWTQANTLGPWLREWNMLKAENARKGSITPQFCVKHKGPMVGDQSVYTMHGRIRGESPPAVMQSQHGSRSGVD